MGKDIARAGLLVMSKVKIILPSKIYSFVSGAYLTNSLHIYSITLGRIPKVTSDSSISITSHYVFWFLPIRYLISLHFSPPLPSLYSRPLSSLIWVITRASELVTSPPQIDPFTALQNETSFKSTRPSNGSPFPPVLK